MTERGGRRVPNKPASYSGVGKNSKRTDGRVQPNRAPSIQESTDLQVGERAVIEKGQAIRPLGRQSAPQIQTSPGGGPAAAEGMLPEHLFTSPSARPSEAVTTGLPFGGGPGPEVLRPQPQDDREVVLDWLASQPNAPQAIVDMQAEIRGSRMSAPSAPMPQPMPEEKPVEDVELPAEDLSPIEPVEEEEFPA